MFSGINGQGIVSFGADAQATEKWMGAGGRVVDFLHEPRSRDCRLSHFSGDCAGNGRGPDSAENLPLADGASTRKMRSEEHTSELQSHSDLVCRLLLEKKRNVAATCMAGTCTSMLAIAA